MASNQQRPASTALFERARQKIPGGVNSPVRAFKGVGGTPVFFERANGAYLYDADGHRYIDYVGSWGPAILGHAHPEVLAAIHAAVDNGTTFGAPTEAEVLFAEEISALVPSMEKLRLVSSGTEATMAALRLARGATGRTKIIKIDGAYHGHADFLLVAAGSGAATLGIPGSAGVTKAAALDTLTVPWNDVAALEAVFENHAKLNTEARIAAIIVEPVCGNMGCVPPAPGYLEAVRRLSAADGAILIFDEVMTGFRVALGGAQARYGIVPDLTCLGKVVGGGLPLAAYGGRADIMANIAPDGPVYQAGTLSGNPVAVAAGRKTLSLLTPALYAQLEATSAALLDGLSTLLHEKSIPHVANRCGAMWTTFFSDGAVTDYTSAKRSDTARFGKFFHAMLDRGVYLAPSQFEAAFMSAAHDASTTAATLDAARSALTSL